MQVTLKNGRAITVRLKMTGDGEALGEMLANCSERTYHFFHPYPLTHESGLKVAANENIICFIAFADDGVAVGYIWIGREGETPTLGICVRDGWQGLGIGRALMEWRVANHRLTYRTGDPRSTFGTEMKMAPGRRCRQRRSGFRMLLRGEPVVDGLAQNRRLLPPVGPSRYSRLEAGFLPCDSRYCGKRYAKPLGDGATNRSGFRPGFRHG